MELEVEIGNLKHRFAHNFPNTELSQILLSEPDEMSVEEFIGAVGVWLNILDMERVNNIGFQIKREMKR